MRLERGALAIVTAAVVLPLVTWLPMWLRQHPWMGKYGIPIYSDAAAGIDYWCAQGFWGLALGLVAYAVAREDRWLGYAIGLSALTVAWRGALIDPTYAFAFAAGAGLLLVMRRTPATMLSRIRLALVGAGAFQSVYVIQQHFGQDFFWGPMLGLQLRPDVQLLGTLGTVDAATAFIAITAPLMPSWLLPLPILAVWWGHSLGSFAALAIGLLIRDFYQPALYRWTVPVRFALGVVVSGIAAYVLILQKIKLGLLISMTGRYLMWVFGLRHVVAYDPVLGLGLGGWSKYVPAWQMQANYVPTKELFREAHSEPVQWIAETGVIGLVILGGWLWTHRAMFRHSLWGASVAAAFVDSFAFFPLHVVTVALLVIIVVGLASAPTDPTPLTKETPTWQH